MTPNPKEWILVRREAMNIARNLVKIEIRKGGLLIRQVRPSEITKAAHAIIIDDPEIYNIAIRNLRFNPETLRGMPRPVLLRRAHQ